MRNSTVLIIKKLHNLVSGNKRSNLTETELLQRYQIEYAILKTLIDSAIDDAPLTCTGCHGEQGIALRITAPDNIKYTLIYIGSEPEIVAGKYNLSIYWHEPKAGLTCQEIYYRKFGQAPNDGWLQHKTSNAFVTNTLLASASQHAS